MTPHHSHLNLQDRSILSAYLRDGLSLRGISEKLNRSVSSISDEIKKNSPGGTRENYDPHIANFKAGIRKWSANKTNPLKNPQVFEYAVHRLTSDQWSPEEISKRIELDYPHDDSMRISHELIYQFVSSPEGKELNLIQHLRRGKPRRHRRKYKPIGRRQTCFRNVKSIHDRPKVANNRERYGDWESDTMEGGRQSNVAVSVQKERKSRVVRLTKIKDKSASHTRRAITKKLKPFPKALRRSLTFDRGTEGAEHEKAAQDLKLQTYFCDPYSSWQKGAVENVIGLVRQYLPKGTDLSKVTSKELKIIENKLNNRPLKCLGWKTPNEVLSAHLKSLGVRFRG
jgi:transposase, IS30 family